jgi:hypothetical protein
VISGPSVRGEHVAPGGAGPRRDGAAGGPTAGAPGV